MTNPLTTNWGKHKVTLTWVPSDTPPEGYKVTSTHGFCFHNGRVLLVKLDHRGWDFPGGTMEEGETPDECFMREVMEEAVVDGKIQMLGYLLVDNREDEFHESHKYPDIGCQIYYRMDIDRIYPFVQDFESSERAVFEVAAVPSKHDGWNSIYQEILDEAVKR